jgi:hypothetical protein
MTKAMFALPFLAACLDNSGPAPYRGNDAPTTPAAFDALHVADQADVVAIGGAQIVTITDRSAVGWSGAATTGFDVEPYADVWPNTRKPEYRVRALAAGSGSFEISTSVGVAGGALASADVDHVALLPADYRLDGHSQFAIDTALPNIQVALFDATGRRLIDGTLVATDNTTATTAKLAWDHLSLQPTAGTHTIRITADSIPEQTLAVELASGVDRVESVQDGVRTCYHAYRGSIEIATMVPLTGTRDPNALNCEIR